MEANKVHGGQRTQRLVQLTLVSGISHTLVPSQRVVGARPSKASPVVRHVAKPRPCHLYTDTCPDRSMYACGRARLRRWMRRPTAQS